jgi:hypothetical protein
MTLYPLHTAAATAVRTEQGFIELHDIQDDQEFEALVDNGKSDSANLDSVFELLVQVSSICQSCAVLLCTAVAHSLHCCTAVLRLNACWRETAINR